MHKTKITREMVYRAVMARETQCAIRMPELSLSRTAPDLWLAQSEDWEDRCHEAGLATNRAWAVIIDTLAIEMGIDVLAIRGEK